MTFQSVPETAQVEIRYRSNSVPWVTTVYARRPGGYDITYLAELASAVDVWAGTGVIVALSQEVSYTGVRAVGLENENDLAVEVVRDPAIAGSVVSSPCPVNVAFTIKFTCGLTGRSTRGRNYVAGIPENQAGSREINSGTAGLLVTKYSGLGSAMQVIGWDHVVVSRYANNAKRATGVTFNVITYSYTDLRLDTQRRRLDNE